MNLSRIFLLLLCLLCWTARATDAANAPAPSPALNANGERLLARYTHMLEQLTKEIVATLPTVNQQQMADLQAAEGEVKQASAAAKAAEEALSKVYTAKALVDHAKGKWLGGAEKGIAQAQAALQKAKTDAERTAAQKELAKWQADKAAGLQALAERQAVYDKAKLEEPKLQQVHQAAQATLNQARTKVTASAQALLKQASPALAGDQLDPKLVKCVVLASATPRGLAEFAQQGEQQEALLEKMLAHASFMQQMLEAGGAKFHKYGRAMEIYAAIRKASPQSRSEHWQRLALAISLEHATPIVQAAKQEATGAPQHVDPVQRYLHYEQAMQAGELDPAFPHFSVWEYRMIVDCDAPDELLAWGRAMLRNYRPEHIHNPDYGWRYSGIVRTDVAYGSQNVHCDLKTLHNYQNIIKNGGVCGRRAFFGRFMLKSFGIPTWGVTQHKHAAISHWTPKGWVVNLGAGFQHSWWDKDEAPRSGSDFLLETQARAHTQDYLQVLRAQWLSRILNEQPYNDRKGVAGGYWSRLAHYQTVALASTAVELGPLGQNLAEANESAAAKAQAVGKVAVNGADKKIAIAPEGTITIPAAACSGVALMNSFGGGHQLLCGSGGKFNCELEVPKAGKYKLTARVVTVHDETQLELKPSATAPTIAMVIPYTCGEWQTTAPVEVTLAQGKNVLSFSKPTKSFALQAITLTPLQP
jgi:chemotaxis protein histidine kinase CheA